MQNTPILGGVTPTAGELVFFGDVGGNFYALDAANGQSFGVRNSAAGGVITYTTNGAQKVAVAIGFISPVWPVKIATAKIAILGVECD